MRHNLLKARLARDEVALGLMLMSGDPHVPGIAAAAGYEYVLADLEHTSLTLRELETLVRAADAAGIVPMTRVAGGRKQDLLAALETGVRGIMVPAVESAEEAREVVQAARYAPFGRRGVFYLGYTSEYAGIPPAEHFRTANEELLLILQVETSRGVLAAGEIAAVPGVDAVLIGPGDLSASLGVPWEWDHPALREAIDTTFLATRMHGKVAGIMPPTVEHAARAVDAGARLLLWGPDLALLLRAALEDVRRLTAALPWRPPERRRPQ
jgi:2-keto-3-deoxy-L-rhamnonate aldolase RhmA